jgi:anti-sigma factor RsiW
MTCRDVVELVTDYLENALPAADRVRFEEHLDECPPCKMYLEQMRHTIAALGGLPREGVPDRIKRGLLDVFRDWKKRPPE